MATTKLTQEGQSRRSEHLTVLRERLAKVKSISFLKSAPEWKQLGDLLTSFIDVEKRKRNVLAERCDEDEPWKVASELREIRGRRNAFELIHDLIEKSDIQVTLLEKNIKELEARYKQAEESLT